MFLDLYDISFSAEPVTTSIIWDRECGKIFLCFVYKTIK